MVQRKIKQFNYPMSESSLQSADTVDFLKIHSKSLKHAIAKLKEI